MTDTTRAEAPTDDERHAIRAYHETQRALSSGGAGIPRLWRCYSQACAGAEWPCPTIRLLNAYTASELGGERARQERDEMFEALMIARTLLAAWGTGNGVIEGIVERAQSGAALAGRGAAVADEGCQTCFHPKHLAEDCEFCVGRTPCPEGAPFPPHGAGAEHAPTCNARFNAPDMSIRYGCTCSADAPAAREEGP